MFTKANPLKKKTQQCFPVDIVLYFKKPVFFPK